uniref:S1 motif domain-containing protein n=1 Tax=viral metagenome TaxID=1070528 RepID=A0A6C0II56_9ZZZZ
MAYTSKQMASALDKSTLFTNALITKKIHVNIQNIGNNIKQTLEKMIASDIEGKCIVEGFVKNGSTKIMTYSSGLIRGSMVTFEVAYECSICSPVEGMNITCIAKNITKAGIRAETNDSPSPVVIFVARDHHFSTPYFSEVKENDEIMVKVIGQRFELNDKYISVIAELLPEKQQYVKPPSSSIKPRTASSSSKASSESSKASSASSKPASLKKPVTKKAPIKKNLIVEE